jgi:DNA-binding Lrp family transcriptional regulator
LRKPFITLAGRTIFGLKTLEAYVLVKIATQTDVCGFSRSVIEKIGKMNGIEKVNLLFGDFDAILKIRMPKIHDIENMVMEEIHMVKGVESTLTLLCVDEKMIE